jgi:hypothetical protein
MNSAYPLVRVSPKVRCAKRTKNSPTARFGSEHLIWECSGNYSAFEESFSDDSLDFRAILRKALSAISILPGCARHPVAGDCACTPSLAHTDFKILHLAYMLATLALVVALLRTIGLDKSSVVQEACIAGPKFLLRMFHEGSQLKVFSAGSHEERLKAL